jgi:hypothetical protein
MSSASCPYGQKMIILKVVYNLNLTFRNNTYLLECNLILDINFTLKLFSVGVVLTSGGKSFQRLFVLGIKLVAKLSPSSSPSWAKLSQPNSTSTGNQPTSLSKQSCVVGKVAVELGSEIFCFFVLLHLVG